MKYVMDWLLDLIYRGDYCVRRCGFYKGNYSVECKSRMLADREYGEYQNNGNIDWVAYEGTYSRCLRWVKTHQTYLRREY